MSSEKIEPIQIDCPECGGDGGFRDIGCCQWPLENGECCGNGVEVWTECRCCDGTGKVEKEKLPI